MLKEEESFEYYIANHAKHNTQRQWSLKSVEVTRVDIWLILGVYLPMLFWALRFMVY